ncbi:MAG: methionine--tRNA ligase [Bacteroidetes bacterium]|nr:MAG: methionine--tRNA ligase [Bacteroidota bacterium]REK05326.1 MAG: methionine--tRNA ligase [Bacteroidota bacterium]REK36395.1 MAG: methionine--tRNA ligase [Bacteroidota bacterium]REK51128.1 MAG: methionine--tRNA ligase [Bacteroidota bacterium]
MKRTLVTSALPYANGPVHIGHLAGAYLPADIYVRFLRIMGEDVKFICGSDEHGVPITLRARKEGVSPQEVVDKYHAQIKKSFEDFGISFDIYHRTSEKIHHETASDFFKTLYKKGVFTEESSEQYYDEEAKMFLADRYITGTCPNCGNAGAYGDQCEKCGKSLSPKDLINPHSQLSGKTPVLKKTKHWYLPLDRMQKEWLEDWILSHKQDWKNNVFGQCKSWLDQGLQPRAVTRDLNWGVPVPLEDADGKVLYVWFDAPIGYISATKALFSNTSDPADWKKYWKDENTSLIHFIGKDNIVFHCIIFPAMLKAHGEFILPQNVPANEFLNLEGDKISTSRNWAVWLHEYMQDFPGKQDVLRYALCSTAPENKDNDFTWKEFQTRNNSELVAILGNFINRTLVLTGKYFENKVPDAVELNSSDTECFKAIKLAIENISRNIRLFKFRDALFELTDLARKGNKYLADNEPWKLYALNPLRTATILNISLQFSAWLSYLMEPFMPGSAVKLRKMLNLNDRKWTELTNESILKPGHSLGTAELLFEKIEDDIIAHQLEKLESSKNQNEVDKSLPDFKTSTSFDDFQKMDIRVGTILEAERVPKTDKLLKLLVDTGLDQRTIVSGIAEFYKPEEIIGKQVSILVNLEPRKIKGIESRGMILMAEDSNGKLAFINPHGQIQNGSVIR